MDRDYRLLTRVILGFRCLGLLVLAGCVGPYLVGGPQLRQARFDYQNEMREAAYRGARRVLEETEASLRAIETREPERQRQREELQASLDQFNKLLAESRDTEPTADR